jgi:hypothetical protein
MLMNLTRPQTMSSQNTALNLAVLKVVSEARNAHGLRLQDPTRYNTYCARRILSVKKSLKFVQKSKKAPPKPVTAELVTQDTRYQTSQVIVLMKIR